MHLIHIQYIVYFVIFEIITLVLSISDRSNSDVDFITTWVIFNGLGVIGLTLWFCGIRFAW